MTRRFVADLHVHSVLSPCAAVEMTPRNIVWNAAEHGIDIIAITDHNASDNVATALEAAKDADVVVLPGMEVETREEIHLVVLFEKIRQLREWDLIVARHRTGRLNDTVKFGAQFVVDADDNLIREKPDMLLESLSLGLNETCRAVGKLGGICIASHVDRPAYSILHQLGFIPPDINLAAVEVSARTSIEEALRRFPALKDFQIVRSSDAHTIADFLMGPKTAFFMEEPTLGEIRQAILKKNLREVMFNR